MEKIAFWGSLASIAGLLLVFYPVNSNSEDVPNNNASTLGSQSPAIGNNSGAITFNYENSPEEIKSHVLRHPDGGAVLIVGQPSLDSALDRNQHVCMAIAGTQIKLLPETAMMGGIEMWQKIEITDGSCMGKIGWSSKENISYE